MVDVFPVESKVRKSEALFREPVCLIMQLFMLRHLRNKL